MGLKTLIENTGLHGGAVKRLLLQHGTLQLAVSDIAIDLDCVELYEVEITMAVSTASKDGQLVATLSDQRDSQNIIQFTKSDNTATLVTESRNYDDNTTKIHSYIFSFRSIEFNVARQVK